MELRTEGMKEVLAILGSVATNLPKEVNIALGKAANKPKTELARQVVKEFPPKFPQKKIKPLISKKTDRANLTATVSLKKTKRIALKHFFPTQTEEGVTARISRQKGKKLYKSAFIIKKFGDNVYHRPNNGRDIARLFGPSPWGVIVKNKDKKDIVIQVAKAEILKQIQRRIDYLTKKKAGII